jgi:hypothetical protein
LRTARRIDARAADLREEDARNGWTEAAIAEHVEQSRRAASIALMQRIFPDRPPLRISTIATYDPHGW